MKFAVLFAILALACCASASTISALREAGLKQQEKKQDCGETYYGCVTPYTNCLNVYLQNPTDIELICDCVADLYRCVLDCEYFCLYAEDLQATFDAINQAYCNGNVCANQFCNILDDVEPCDSNNPPGPIDVPYYRAVVCYYYEAYCDNDYLEYLLEQINIATGINYLAIYHTACSYYYDDYCASVVGTKRQGSLHGAVITVTGGETQADANANFDSFQSKVNNNEVDGVSSTGKTSCENCENQCNNCAIEGHGTQSWDNEEEDLDCENLDGCNEDGLDVDLTTSIKFRESSTNSNEGTFTMKQYWKFYSDVNVNVLDCNSEIQGTYAFFSDSSVCGIKIELNDDSDACTYSCGTGSAIYDVEDALCANFPIADATNAAANFGSSCQFVEYQSSLYNFVADDTDSAATLVASVTLLVASMIALF